MQKYITQIMSPDEGFGAYMSTLASVYCVSTYSRLKPAFIKNQKSDALLKFNSGVEEAIDFDEAFPNLSEYFSVLQIAKNDIKLSFFHTINTSVLPPHHAAYFIDSSIRNERPKNILLDSFVVYNNLSSHIGKLKEIFTFSDSITQKAKTLMPQTSKKLIGVSTRYLNFPKEAHILSLGLDYYKKAFSYFNDKECLFIVSGDDPNEPKEFFKPLSDKYDICYLPRIHSAIGMCLFSMCDGIINSNSSFSFWASILNDTASQMQPVPIICSHNFLIDGISISEHMNGKWYPKIWTAL